MNTGEIQSPFRVNKLFKKKKKDIAILHLPNITSVCVSKIELELFLGNILIFHGNED